MSEHPAIMPSVFPSKVLGHAGASRRIAIPIPQLSTPIPCAESALEGAIAGVERHPDPSIAKADNVGAPVAGQVGQEAWVLLDAPAAGVIAEVIDHQLRRLEGAVAIIERYPDPGIAKADDVGPPVAGQVGQEARVL